MSNENNQRSRQRGRVDEIESRRRVNEIIEALNRGCSTYDIVQSYAGKWRIQERQIREYIARAKSEIFALLEIEKDEHMALILSRHETVYKKACEVGDYKTATASLRAMSAIFEKHLIQVPSTFRFR